jgi:hypothetical protein
MCEDWEWGMIALENPAMHHADSGGDDELGGDKSKATDVTQNGGGKVGERIDDDVLVNDGDEGGKETGEETKDEPPRQE